MQLFFDGRLPFYTSSCVIYNCTVAYRNEDLGRVLFLNRGHCLFYQSQGLSELICKPEGAALGIVKVPLNLRDMKKECTQPHSSFYF